MVACRTTDRLNTAISSGSISQVPLRRNRQGNSNNYKHHPFQQTPINHHPDPRKERLSGIKAILNWIWPEDRCTNCSSIYTISLSDIHHTVTIHDNRLLGDETNGGGGGVDVVDHPLTHEQHQQIAGLCGTIPRRSRDSLANQSQSSGSDDGGFLAARPPPLVTIRTRAQLAQATVVGRPHPPTTPARMSWRRRPLVNCPSQLSFRSDGSGQSYNYNRYSNLLSRWYLDRQTNPVAAHRYHLDQQPPRLYLNYPPLQEDLEEAGENILRAVPATTFNDDLRINTISGNVQSPPAPSTPFTPQSRISRVHASSPASSAANASLNAMLVNSPWSPLYFSDLSSVRQPSSAERSFPTPMSGLSLRYMQQDRELPALRTIHEETRRLAQAYLPSSGTATYRDASPLSRYNSAGATSASYGSHSSMRPIRSRLFPRQSRFTRTVGDLAPAFPTYPYNHRSMLGVEISPASRSSSSGFGSKNTSTQPNHSSHSAGSHSNEWRTLPPYRPPPTPPISTLHHQYNHYHPYSNVPFNARQFEGATGGGGAAAGGGGAAAMTIGPNWRLLKRTTLNRSPSSPPPLSYNSPYNMDHWLDLMQRVSDMPGTSKAVDVGSVDGHYEFDPATPTPTASTPTGPPVLMTATDLGFDNSMGLSSPSTSFGGGHHNGGGQHHFRKRPSRYENIEARVQAMKEEFYAYKKKQAMSRLTAAPLESAC